MRGERILNIARGGFVVQQHADLMAQDTEVVYEPVSDGFSVGNCGLEVPDCQLTVPDMLRKSA
jgi:hypothetical protein